MKTIKFINYISILTKKKYSYIEKFNFALFQKILDLQELFEKQSKK